MIDQPKPDRCGVMVTGEPLLYCALESDHAGEHEIYHRDQPKPVAPEVDLLDLDDAEADILHSMSSDDRQTKAEYQRGCKALDALIAETRAHRAAKVRQERMARVGGSPEKALADVRTLCDFAYQQGFHEMGYDPVDALREYVASAAKLPPVEVDLDKLQARLDLAIRIEPVDIAALISELRALRAWKNKLPEGAAGREAARAFLKGIE